MNHPSGGSIPVPVELIKYLGASIAGTALHYGLLLILVRFIALTPLQASTCGAVAGAVTIYTLNYFCVFRSSRRHLVSLSRFGLVAAGGLVVNGAILSAALTHLSWPLVAAQVLATGLQFSVSFVVNRIWTF